MKAEYVDFDPNLHEESFGVRLELFRGGFELYFDNANERIEEFLDFHQVDHPSQMIIEQKTQIDLIRSDIEEKCPFYGRKVSIKSDLHGIQPMSFANADGITSFMFTEGLFEGTFIGFELSEIVDPHGFVLAEYGLIARTIVDIAGKKHIFRTPLAKGDVTPFAPAELN